MNPGIAKRGVSGHQYQTRKSGADGSEPVPERAPDFGSELDCPVVGQPQGNASQSDRNVEGRPVSAYGAAAGVAGAIGPGWPLPYQFRGLLSAHSRCVLRTRRIATLPTTPKGSTGWSPLPLVRWLPGGANQFACGLPPAVAPRLSRLTGTLPPCMKSPPPVSSLRQWSLCAHYLQRHRSLPHSIAGLNGSGNRPPHLPGYG